MIHAVMSVGAIERSEGPPRASSAPSGGSAVREATSVGATFRQDINALRAWAVIAVVGYHFNIAGFASGFVGVDIFFVISGFLMTGQVLQQLQAKRFSLSAFWLARLRRIFPALLVLILSTVVLGWCLSMPDAFLRQVRQTLFALTFSSNISLDDQRGYFDVAAQTKPLLHTWSLAIEWQFYLCLPFLLLAVWRVTPAPRRERHVLLALVFFTLASMAWCLLASVSDAGSGFFSLRARAWELLAGGVIACAHRLAAAGGKAVDGSRPAVRAGVLAAAAGWILVGLTALSGLSSGHWPGPWTLLPVLGSALIIWGGPIKAMQCLTASRPVQRVGDWSYSIYLWHWPLWVFAQQWASYHDVPVQWPAQAALLMASVALGYLSFRYVEQPTRLRRDLWTPSRMWTGYALALGGLAVFTVAAVKTHGFPDRVPPYQQRAELARRTNTPRDECFRNAQSQKRDPAQFCEFGSASGPKVPQAMLWGDSLANQYLEPLSAAAAQWGLGGLIATQSGCRALWLEPTHASDALSDCERFNHEVLDYLHLHAQAGIVILGRNWSNSEASATEAFSLVRRLLAEGKTVVLILPLLNPGFDVPERWMREQFRVGHAIDEWRLKATPELIQETLRSAISRQLLEFADNPRLVTVDLLPQICSDGECFLVRGGQANYRDTIHISNLNASQYQAIFSRALGQAVHAAQAASP